jgi:uracil-DNA glycosylase
MSKMPLSRPLPLLPRLTLECEACNLRDYRTQIVPWQEPKENWNHIFLIGEAPGEDEDREGLPFIGKSGNLVNACLLTAGLKRDETYVSNIVKCRPPSNNIRHPDALIAVELCPTIFLYREIDKWKPRVIVSLGATAMKFFTGEREMTSKNGFVWESLDFPDCVLVTLVHPAFILRGGADKKVLIDGFKKAKEFAHGN